MLAARQQEPERLAAADKESEALGLTIDGRQPEQGHETFYVVRALTSTRVWCAEPVLSRAEQAGHRVVVLARPWAERLATPGRAWMSDKQEAFVKAIATACPGSPHRDCHTHFLRDVAKPVLAIDRQAQVTRRRKVRGVRASARGVLAERRHAAASASPPPPAPPQGAATSTAALPAAVTPAPGAAPEPCAASAGGLRHTEKALEATRVATTEDAAVEVAAGEVGLGDGAAGRGRRNESQGGPLPPPGVRMSEALQEGRDARERNLGAPKGGLPSRC
jgi:hypothetical protein